MVEPFFKTELGELYHGDCSPILMQMIGQVQADLIFCDPPFNLNKQYGEHVDDSLRGGLYSDWLKSWLAKCVYLLAPGGSLMVYNLPKWNIFAASYLLSEGGLDFVDWVAVRVTQGFPRSKGLYRGHYGIIHFTNGKPRVLNKIRVPIETCRHCKGELRDYGGHRSKMSVDGVSVSDIWTDIPTVRHAKYKTPGWHGPQLSTKLVRRCILLATNPGDVVLDPFAGSGTTPAVCEAEGRRWVAIEKGDCSIIQARIEQKNTAFHKSFDRVNA
jgi:site-specific DNA-methyltransferase (adenine-specific)